ncbi:MAG: class I SAM-dependent methyltransferase [Candidatus Rokuibacteriota bacterium]
MPSPVNPRLLAWLASEPLGGATALDVGTGRGALVLALAPQCRRVIGIDRDAAAIHEARRRAGVSGIDNVEFVVADAEDLEYAPFAPDLVVAHLCMSDAIVERAGRVLPPRGVLAFVCFHADQWRETGRRSRFAYDEDQVESLLARTGFTLESMNVDREVRDFHTVEEGLAAAVGLEERWRADGRWIRFLKFLEEGGRTLTRSHLVVKARRR